MNKKKSAEKSKNIFRFKAKKNMLNSLGTLHGGELVKQYDNAAGYTAAKYSEGKVVTVAIKEVIFKKKIMEGQTVKIITKVFHVGKSSIHIYATGYLLEYDEFLEKIGTAYLVFVAIDNNNNNRTAPDLYFEKEDEKMEAEKLKKKFNIT